MFSPETLLAAPAEIEQKLAVAVAVRGLLIKGLEVAIDSEFGDLPVSAAKVKPFQ